MTDKSGDLTTPHDLTLLRLAAQRIAGTGFDTVAEAVGWLTALQAQDHPGAVTSIALRTRSRSRADVESALNAGEVVKSWPMRGTLHFVLAEDLPWMLELTAPRIIATAAARQAQLELDDRTMELAREAAIEALVGHRELSRAQMLATWERAGVSTAGQRGYHLLWHLAQTGTMCFGPIRDGDPQLVLINEWIPRPRKLARAEALGELALRFFRGHGPATIKDLGRWAKLVAADVRSGVSIARPQLAAVAVDGVEYLMDPQTPERLEGCRKEARGVFLLPGFDEYLLGYADRSAALPSQFAQLIVPGGNGMFKPTVVADGQVVGTWSSSGRGVKRTVLATPFQGFTKRVAAAIPRLHGALP
jgi:Winged helix DNA-binding domain